MTVEIKHRNRVRFNDWSKVYDRSVLQRLVFNAAHDTFFSEMTPYLKDAAGILDVGCGTGKLSLKLHKFNPRMRVHGVDLSDDMIGKARAKVTDNSIEFKVGDVEHLPYEADTFDVITCSHSFHHYPNQKKALSEMHRVLKDGGRVMVVDGCRDKLLGNIIFKIVEIVEKQVYHMYMNEMSEMMKSVGFEDVKQRIFNPIAPLLFSSAEAKKWR